MSKICLNMIVKNEAENLPRLLASVRDQISCYAIVDTGSTDDTVAIIKDHLDHLPGYIAHDEFVNFSQARNAALNAASWVNGGYDYLLLADADMELVGEIPAGDLSAPVYLMYQQAGTLAYQNIRLVHRDAVVGYRGATHEYLETTGEQFTLQGPYFLDHADGSNRADKFARDIRLLTHEVADEPDNARSWLYLAQSYRDMGNRAMARALYQHRASLGGWDEEVWYSKYQVAVLNEFLETDPSVIIKGYTDAFRARPHRAEPLRWLARYLGLAGRGADAAAYDRIADNLSLPDDRLFVETRAYGPQD